MEQGDENRVREDTVEGQDKERVTEDGTIDELQTQEVNGETSVFGSLSFYELFSNERLFNESNETMKQ